MNVSDRKDITPLTKVVNPMAWITRLEFNSMIYRLNIALAKNDTQEMQQYIAWAQDISKRTPRVNIYLHWARALDRLNRNEEALALLEKVHVLYPNSQAVLRYVNYFNQKIRKINQG
eukprot:TRINITY_DN12533_c0_g1_i1.p1 TRINITY_DN12533_c0_g1~~TRINITY_DN12533_c0_g1_i1.p1  ORF type:complete len:117 (+),score=3.72 TRINITY_DN12533_c0_g1_i1:239-589(+)